MQSPKNKDIKKLARAFTPWQLLAIWPADLPLVFLGGSGRYAIIPVAWSPATADEVLNQEIIPPATLPTCELPFVSGVIGLLSYSTYGESRREAPSRFVWTYSALVFDQRENLVYLTGDPLDRKALFKLPLTWIDHIFTAEISRLPVASGRRLTCNESEEEYESKVRLIIEEIKSGRYYQLNLLRYFLVEGGWNHLELVDRLQNFGGPFASWLKFDDVEIVSFSPERFIRFHPKAASRLRVETFPIKGTAARHGEPRLDQKVISNLRASIKDNAELHMIVDLMRNDLNRVSQPASVQVFDPGSVHSFRSLHHLIAHVEGELISGLTLGEFLDRVLPAGSITGAPKVEVMRAIRTYEGRSREWFMGNAFYWDLNLCSFDSSLLIRTMVRKKFGDWLFAAGGGIVLGSEPALEREEVATKCRVITEERSS